jgi:Tfp pilus assembly pilus retraction ATPase PilT
MYSINDLLNLVIAEKAEELHLDFGVPPAIRVRKELNVIEGPEVTTENIKLLLQSIASEQQIQEIKNRGNLKFIFPFGEHHFRVSATTRGDSFTVKIYNLDQK